MAAPYELVLEEATKAGYKFDLSNWTIYDFQLFNEFINANKFVDAVPYAINVIVEWPFGDAKDPEAYKKLKLLDYKNLLKYIGAAVTQLFSEGN